MKAPNGIATINDNCEIAKATPGERTRRANHAPPQLPAPSPNRKTASRIENVYVVGPNNSPSQRVQMIGPYLQGTPHRPVEERELVVSASHAFLAVVQDGVSYLKRRVPVLS